MSKKSPRPTVAERYRELTPAGEIEWLRQEVERLRAELDRVCGILNQEAKRRADALAEVERLNAALSDAHASACYADLDRDEARAEAERLKGERRQSAQDEV